MHNSAKVCRQREAHHREIAANATLANVRAIAVTAAEAWAKQAEEAEDHEAGVRSDLSDADMAIALEFRLEGDGLTGDSDKGIHLGEAARHREKTGPRPIDLAGALILVVEDEPLLSALLESAVSEAGGSVVGPALDVASAMSLIATEPIEGAILDLIVQGVHCEKIAEELKRRDIPFAVTTGIGADDDHPLLRDALTITKPFQREYVQEVLHGLLKSV